MPNWKKVIISGSNAELNSLNVTTNITASFFTGSFVGDGSGLTGVGGDPFPYTGNAQITGSLLISSSVSESLTVHGSGSTLFEIIGSVGSVFSIDDSLSGSLMVVSDISGIPQFEVFSDGIVTIGSTPTSLHTTSQISSTATATNQSVYTLSTSSYDGAWFNYTVISASNMRAGTVMSIWEAGTSNINFTETTTTDIGDTLGVEISAVITGSEAALQVNTSTPSWKIKTIVRSI